MRMPVQRSNPSGFKSYLYQHQLFVIGHDLPVNPFLNLFPGYVVIFFKVTYQSVRIHKLFFYCPSNESRATWANGIGNSGSALVTVTPLPANKAACTLPSRMRSYRRWPSMHSSQARSFNKAVIKS